MSAKNFKVNRAFLKDSIRQRIDFSQTAQARRQPAPPLQKPCPPEVQRIALPDGRASLARLGRMSVGEAIAGRESFRDYSAAPLAIEELAMLLWATQGVREVVNLSCALRTVPSAGARHAFETYLAVSRVETLPSGLYRFLPFDGQLAQLAVDAHIGRRAAIACLGQSFVTAAAVTFLSGRRCRRGWSGAMIWRPTR